jgi:mRNA-degrading endonuclease toxin of MazEF toxin-antitoxin module
MGLRKRSEDFKLMHQGDVYLVQLPVVDGREQAGSRPTIIIQDPVTGGPPPLS